MTSRKFWGISGLLIFLIFLPFIYMVIEVSMLPHPKPSMTFGLILVIVWIGWGIAPLLLLALFGVWVYALIQHFKKSNRKTPPLGGVFLFIFLYSRFQGQHQPFLGIPFSFQGFHYVLVDPAAPLRFLLPYFHLIKMIYVTSYFIDCPTLFYNPPLAIYSSQRPPISHLDRWPLIFVDLIYTFFYWFFYWFNNR